MQKYKLAVTGSLWSLTKTCVDAPGLHRSKEVVLYVYSKPLSYVKLITVIKKKRFVTSVSVGIEPTVFSYNPKAWKNSDIVLYSYSGLKLWAPLFKVIVKRVWSLKIATFPYDKWFCCSVLYMKHPLMSVCPGQGSLLCGSFWDCFQFFPF